MNQSSFLLFYCSNNALLLQTMTDELTMITITLSLQEILVCSKNDVKIQQKRRIVLMTHLMHEKEYMKVRTCGFWGCIGSKYLDNVIGKSRFIYLWANIGTNSIGQGFALKPKEWRSTQVLTINSIDVGRVILITQGNDRGDYIMIELF